MHRISIVVPCYNEESTLSAFSTELKIALQALQTKYPELACEVIFVNDGSRDKTSDLIKTAPCNTGLANEAEVHYIDFSRNYGKEAAMFAGLQKTTGDFVAIMDADLQDPPMLLPKMFDILWNQGCDSVAMRRVSRKGEPPIRSFFARVFYKVINKISDVDIVDGARDYRLMTRQMTDAVLSLHERNRFTKGIFGWVGFETYWFEYENTSRIAGESKFTFWSLCKYATQGITSFSSVPLAGASVAGVLLSFIAIIFMLVVIVRAMLFGDPVAGWPSLMCVILFVGSLQLLGIGILGTYLARTYTETKQRPLYVIKAEGSLADNVA